MSLLDEAGDHVRELVQKRDIGGLGRALFNLKARPTYEGPGSWVPGQMEIASLFAFLQHRRVAISAHTRYGKTFGAGVGLAINTIVDPRPLKVALIGPRDEQARLIRGEYVDVLARNPLGRRLLGVGNRTIDDRMRRELSRKKLDFRDGKRLRVMTTGPDGEGIMGEGADVVVVDECDLVPEDAWPKILRMLGDNPDESVLILIGNPWKRGGRFHKALTNPAYKVIQIDYHRGILEGRITRDFVEEQRADLPPALFQVFYDSTFPDDAEGQLLSWPNIEAATVRPSPKVWPPLDGPHEIRYGLDVAEGGADYSVLSRASVQPARRRLECQWDWHYQDTMKTADTAAQHMMPGSEVRVDATGVGKGVADRLRQLGFRVIEFKAGVSARDSARYRDAKAESWWELRDALERGEITIPELRHVRDDWARMTWRIQAGRLVVEELDGKSPDWGDSAHLALMEGIRAPTASVVQSPKRWGNGLPKRV